MNADASLCACGSGQDYSECCGRFIEAGQKPETAEQLMRSRYTAYTKKNIDYIDTTHYPGGPDDFDRKQAQVWAENARWDGLEIIYTEAGGANDQTGIVEFKVKFAMNEQATEMHEISTFKKKAGVWYYLDGKHPVQQYRRETPKVGRNDPCTCGSGKKFKKCCGANA